MGERIRKWIAKLIHSPPITNTLLEHYPEARVRASLATA
jgi:hypothetical protein